MSRYLEIIAAQRPFPAGEDTNGRLLFSCNFRARSVGVVTAWEEEVVKILTNAGLATLGTDTFIGPAAVIPAGKGPYVSVIDSGGVMPEHTHDGITYERLSAQVVVRVSPDKYAIGRTRALAIWRALDGQRNQTVAA